MSNIINESEQYPVYEPKPIEEARPLRDILTVQGLIEQLEGFDQATPVVGSIAQSHRVYGNVSVDEETEDKEDSDDIRDSKSYCVISVGATGYSPSQVVGESKVDEKKIISVKQAIDAIESMDMGTVHKVPNGSKWVYIDWSNQDETFLDDKQLIEMAKDLPGQEEGFYNESKKVQEADLVGPNAFDEPTSVVKQIAEWIHMDVTDQQIEAVLWAMMMGNLEDKVKQEVIKMRQDYEAERNDEGQYYSNTSKEM